MYIQVGASEIYCYTGGRRHDPTKPTVLFIHGVLNDHSVWALQSRYLANHGWNVLALDLPGHCRSSGEPPETVEAAAKLIGELLDAAGLQRVAVIGHSWGSLIALEAAAQLQERITHLILVGIAYPMKVSPALLDASLNRPQEAIRTINVFSRSTLAAPPSLLGPGTWIWGLSTALNRRVFASNRQVNLFHRGFQACDSYIGGEQAMQGISCPVLFVLGSMDAMTPAKAAQMLINAARHAGKSVQIVELTVGHHQMGEAPEKTLNAIRGFLLESHPTNR
jgi:pimeloyl-ACP methyl ester carboxylesterase